jgi:hypothetical protein
VFAPLGGTAYVHDDGATGFGKHVNLDLHDGTYLLMAHLDDVFITNATDVAPGQLLGFEGTTGNSSGDHVHFGRHSGDARKSALYGASLEGIKIRAWDRTLGVSVNLLSEDAVCALSGGHEYVSYLGVAHWHPEGTLLKAPDSPTVYLRLEDNRLSAFSNEEAFLSRGYSFSDVVLMSDEELQCYETADVTDGVGEVRAVRDSDGGGWLLLGTPDDPERMRLRVREQGALGVLQSYGVIANSFDDIDHGNDAEINAYPRSGTANYRDGALVQATGKSDVYVMESGVAMPIRDWDTYLFMGFGTREIIQVDSADFTALIRGQGDCATDTACLTRADITTCGHAEEVVNAEDEQEADLPEGDDSGVHDDSGVAGKTVRVIWETPDAESADWITVAGTWTFEDGTVTAWDPVLAETHDADALMYERSGAQSGDELRFSVAYGRGGNESWSCLAPYPPGSMQGALEVQVDGVPVSVSTTADPESDGCQLQLLIP